jgi:ABC-type multidrug transport system fused ATPase/permease subunit
VKKHVSKHYLLRGLSESLRTLDSGDKKRLTLVILMQFFLGLVDLVGVILIGVLGALTVSGIANQEIGDRVSIALKYMSLEDSTFETQSLVIALSAALLLISRTVISVSLVKASLRFLSLKAAKLTGNIVNKMLSQSFQAVESRSLSEMQFIVNTGINSLVTGVIGTLVIIISDVALMTILALGLLIASPMTALGAILYFAIISVILLRITGSELERKKIELTQLQISSNELLTRTIENYRDLTVKDQRWNYIKKITEMKLSMADKNAYSFFVPQLSKYVLEGSVVVGALILSAFQFITNTSMHAIGTLVLFLAAGMRITPAIIRVQQGITTLRGEVAAAEVPLELIRELENSDVTSISRNQKFILDHEGFNPSVSIKNLQFQYAERTKPALENCNVEIEAGQFIAIVGPSGAGKTTLADLVLGLLTPSLGICHVSGLNSTLVKTNFPGALGYVPQEIRLFGGSVAENIALGYELDADLSARIIEMCKLPYLSNLINELPSGLDTQVGERGTKLSGGQKQRIGIARALLTKPLLIVLDEATSALDAETEYVVNSAIKSLRGNVTVISIAHRLSTIRSADLVLYLENGKIVAVGDFDYLRKTVANFNSQAEKMGL